ncbi:MAG: MarR family transcriptional regulator [Pseudomonadota bacterium]
MTLSSTTLEQQLTRVRDLESRLTFRLSVLSKLLDQQAVALLDDAPINLTGYRILNVINTFGEISISDISRFCAIDRAQVSRAAAELSRQELVAFRSDPVSKRKKIVVLTAEGGALLNELSPRFLARNTTLNEVLGAERREALLDAINRLSAHVSP